MNKQKWESLLRENRPLIREKIQQVFVQAAQSPSDSWRISVLLLDDGQILCQSFPGAASTRVLEHQGTALRLIDLDWHDLSQPNDLWAEAVKALLEPEALKSYLIWCADMGSNPQVPFSLRDWDQKTARYLEQVWPDYALSNASRWAEEHLTRLMKSVHLAKVA